MNWKNEAVQDLKKLPLRRAAVVTLEEELKEIKARLHTMQGAGGRAAPVQGGSSRVEDRWIALIDEKDRKAESLSIAKRKLAATMRGLAALTEQQRDILSSFFVQRTPGHVEQLAQKYHIERTQIYRLKDEALRDFTLARYGVVET